eukprot:5151852-Pyramimonas_sp.AAC.1
MGSIRAALYRASHVLKVSSYWSTLYSSVMRLISDELVIVHAHTRTQHYRDTAEQILRNTWCNGLPDDMLSKRRRRTKDECLRVFVGNWASKQMLYWRRRPGCAGGEARRTAAVDHAKKLVARLLFSRCSAVPSISRWWKCTPLMRIICLGIAFHALWPRSCPNQAAQAAPQAGDAARDDLWHQVHNFRVKKTWDFFHASSTASS